MSLDGILIPPLNQNSAGFAQIESSWNAQTLVLGAFLRKRQ